MIKDILLLGDTRLYQTSQTVKQSEVPTLAPLIADLHDTLLHYRKTHGASRAIAAPQIGAPLRLLYMHIDAPVVFLNPALEFPDAEMMEVLDDCMSFPHLLVRVKRYKRCCIRYRDLQWQEQNMCLEGDLSELLQHEYDHLDGILATMRAIDSRAFYAK